MAKKRIHILTAVNAGAVSKAGSVYTIAGVCGATDAIVMNSTLYPADQLAKAAPTLEGKPAPAGHPKNGAGQYISALNGEALLNSYAGAVCKNARHEGGRTLVDVVINEAQAKASEPGAKLIERLDAALNGTSVEPIHVSTGLVAEMVAANGESRGKKYTRVATNIQYDHLAILLNERGAGTPDDGVGMWLNSAGEPEEVENAEFDPAPADRRFEGLTGWIRKLLGNSSELSFDQIREGLYKALPENAWVMEVFDRYAIWSDRDNRMWRQSYAVDAEGSVAFVGDAVEVTRRVKYEEISTNREADIVKETILAALNSAGIKTEGLSDAGLLDAYNQLQAKPVREQLAEVTGKLATIEANARAAEEGERTTLATELAVNSLLTVDDLKALPLARLRELKAAKPGAAPLLTGNAGAAKPGDEFAGYDLNATLKEGK